MKKVLIFSVLGLLLSFPVYAQTNSTVDVTKPIISSVSVSSITKSTSLISWVTNEPATSYVDFGPTDIYGNTLGSGDYLTSHGVTLLGLTAETPYHFRIRSKDAAGNEAVSTDTTFTTLAATSANLNTTVNSNKNANTNLNSNKNTNINKNANTNKNTNTNKNSNSNKNANLNSNVNSNANLDDSTVSNLNTNDDSNVNSADITNLNTNEESTSTSGDGRMGLALIIGGVVLLIVIIVVAWKKLRQPPTLRP
jgi:hypothetical protein